MLVSEMEFEPKIRALLGEYGYSLRDVTALLDPQGGGRKAAPAAAPIKGNRKPPDLKVFKNPHTREIVETKGRNHKLLKAWKAEHGAAEVDSWLAK